METIRSKQQDTVLDKQWTHTKLGGKTSPISSQEQDYSGLLRSAKKMVAKKPKQASLRDYWRTNLKPTVNPYLDNFAIALPTSHQAQVFSKLTKEVLGALGIQIKEDKSCCQPSIQIKLLGLVIDTKNELLVVPKDKLTSIKYMTKEILKTQQIMEAKCT